MRPLHIRKQYKGGPGTAVTLLHGVGSSHAVWDEVIPHLPRDLPILRYDLRGHGESSKPPGPYQLDDFVQDHREVLGDLGLRRTHLVGFSLGGLIAQAVALDAQDTVDKLVLISSAAGRTDQDWEDVRRRLRTLTDEGPEAIADTSAERWFTDHFRRQNPHRVYQHLRSFKANDPAAYLAAYRVLAENDLGNRLSDLRHPTLAITGELDRGSPPRMGEFMRRKIPDCRLVVCSQVKHAILLERPTEVARHIGSFLSPRA